MISLAYLRKYILFTLEDNCLLFMRTLTYKEKERERERESEREREREREIERERAGQVNKSETE